LAQNITWMGSSYTGVEKITLPKTGGGNARFDDASVTTAVASDVASGKIFLASNGTITTGTATGGGTTFISAVGYDPDDDKWYLQESYSDIAAAYNAGKTVAYCVSGYDDENAVADGVWDNGTIKYRVNWYNFDTYKYYEDEYTQTGNSISTVTRVSRHEMYPNPVYKDSSDLVVSGQYVSVPVGVYENIAWAQVASGSVTAPSSISGSSATVSTGYNTLTLSKTVSVTPNVTTAGYVSSGTAGNSSVSLSANVTTKAAATITPGTANQTIASGTYLTGAQTILGDQNLIAGNIKSGTTIFNVTGTYSGGGGGGMNKQIYFGSAQVATNTYTATDVKLKVAVSGTYKISWSGWRNTTSGTSGSQLYKNGTAIGTANTSFTITNYGQVVTLTGIQLAANDDIVVWARARSTSYQMRVANLCIEQTS